VRTAQRRRRRWREPRRVAPDAANRREAAGAANGLDRRDAVNRRGKGQEAAKGCGWDGMEESRLGECQRGAGVSWEDWGSWEEQAFYSAQMLLRARIWPGSGRGGILTRQAADGPAATGRA